MNHKGMCFIQRFDRFGIDAGECQARGDSATVGAKRLNAQISRLSTAAL